MKKSLYILIFLLHGSYIYSQIYNSTKTSSKSGVYTKNNCAVGCTGTSVTYTSPVLSQTRTSTTSQADADTKAQTAADSAANTDVASNGQNYANANGSCINCPTGNPIWVNTGLTRCVNCMSEIQQKDTNTLSSTYNQVQWISGGTACGSTIQISFQKQNPTNSQINNGLLTANVTGGASAYNYLWSNGKTTQTIDSLPNGTYCVQVTDTNGCIMNKCELLESPVCSLTVNGVLMPPTKYGRADGYASTNPAGNNGNITYKWNTGDTSQNLTNISAGKYCVTITDTAACSIVWCDESFIIDSCRAFPAVIQYSKTDPSSKTASDGGIQLSVSGGKAPYTYLWTNGGTTANQQHLKPGTYCITVVDAWGCSVMDCIYLNYPCEMTVQISSKAPTNNTQDNGSMLATASGGTPPYTYVWNNSIRTPFLWNLAMGSSYGVTVTDNVGCTAKACDSITTHSAVYNISLDEKAFSITQNPIEDKVSILWNTTVWYPKQIILRDIIGNIVRREELKNASQYDIDVPELNTGVYFIEIENTLDNKKYIKKIVKK